MAISEKAVIKELIWYYGTAHHELGIISSFGNMITSAFGFSQDNSINHTEDKFIAICMKKNSPVKKLRKIEKSLRSMNKHDRRILDALYGNYNFPPQLYSMFGEKCGSAIFNTVVIEILPLLKLCSKKLSKQHLTLEEKSNLNLIEKEKNLLYNQAHKSYLIERNRIEGLI